MKLLKVLLKASPTFYVNPLWVSWGERVEAWRSSFQGTAFQMAGTPVVDFPRAVVYVQAPDNVTEAQLDSLRRHWSERTGGVTVDGAPMFTNSMAPASTDADLLKSRTLSGQITDQLAGLVGQTGRWLLFGGIVIAAVYGLTRSRGDQSWS